MLELHVPHSFAPLVQIATVDKYQGQQNDYILLSLVRTRAVGHIRDVRRLVVALSRARLGLYIFGRAELFANCYELRPAMKQLLARPHHLHLHPSERLQVSLRMHSSIMLVCYSVCMHACREVPFVDNVLSCGDASKSPLLCPSCLSEWRVQDTNSTYLCVVYSLCISNDSRTWAVHICSEMLPVYCRLAGAI